MNKLAKEFFERHSTSVAKDLLGRYLFLKLEENTIIRARLREIGAYQGKAPRMPEGILYDPGMMFVAHKYGHFLLDISTGQSNKPSCITLRGADLLLEETVEPVHGPGNLAMALGITENNWNDFDGARVNGKRLWITGNSVSPSHIISKKPNASNCKGIYSFE